MKVRASVKKICDKCKVIHRKGVVRVICETPSTSSGKDNRLEEHYGTYCRRRSSAQQARNIALTYIYGIGNPRAARILDEAKVDPMKKVQDLGEDEVNRIRQVIEAEGMVEGDLRKEVSMNIKRLIEIGSYRGYRHRRNLPVRGQRTHTNARTRKGPRKGTVAARRNRRQRHRKQSSVVGLRSSAKTGD